MFITELERLKKYFAHNLSIRNSWSKIEKYYTLICNEKRLKRKKWRKQFLCVKTLKLIRKGFKNILESKVTVLQSKIHI